MSLNHGHTQKDAIPEKVRQSSLPKCLSGREV